LAFRVGSRIDVDGFSRASVVVVGFPRARGKHHFNIARRYRCAISPQSVFPKRILIMKNVFSVLRSKGAKLAAAASAMSLTAAAHADSVLPSTFTADMGDVRTDILAIGGALIGLAVVAVGIKWVKATFFG
jgi:hypothetical protein